MAYEFNGMDYHARMSKFLKNVTEWEAMELIYEAPSIVGTFGLYKYYLICDYKRYYRI